MPTFCVPTLSSLPGSPASDFDWWSAAPVSTLLRYYPDNPNWLGAFSLSQGNGANRDVLFRALRGVLGGQDYLLLQWVARTSALNPAIDRVNVLLGTPSNYVAFNARLNTASSTVAGTQNPPDNAFNYRINSCSVSGGVISIVSPSNTSAGDIENTGRMWVDVTSPTRQIQTKWAFQVAIPLGVNWGAPGIAVNLPASGAFKLWFEVWPSAPLAMAIGPFQWPTTAPQTTSVLQIIPSGITESQMLDMSTAGAGCTDAVQLTGWSNVGTRAVPGGAARPDITTLKLDLGKPYPPNIGGYNVSQIPDVAGLEHRNRFFAIPTLPAGLSGPQKAALRATFSLANWGSQYSDATASSWRPIPGGTDTLFDVATGECGFIWPTVLDSFVTTLVQNINKYLNAEFAGTTFPATAQNPHQCMLAELSSEDPTVIITQSSVYQNMNVTNASTFSRSASISVVGAPPISAQPRDVYLYVQKFNMPNIVRRDERPPRVTFGKDNFSFAASRGPQFNDVEDIAAFVPTYTVHGYIDTGKKLELEDGRKVAILRPQTAFGYFVLHDGNLFGWETRLYGALKLAEDFYVIRVPNNGSAYVETAIQARESANEKPLPETRLPGGCLFFLLRLVGIRTR